MARILLMEDDVDQADLLAELISREGHRVSITASAEEAIELVNREVYDLVVTDLFVRRSGVLANGGGLRLIGYLRNGKRTGQIVTGFKVPIIALSGVLDGPSHGHFLKIATTSGANARLEKPVSAQLLYETIDRLLAEQA